MNAATLSLRTVLILLCTLAVPTGLAAEDHANKAMHHHYKLIDLGTFGGPNTNFVTQGVGAQVLNNRG